MTVSRKKLIESAQKLKTHCDKHKCEDCVFYTGMNHYNCNIGNPNDWVIPTKNISLSLSDSELDEIIAALAHRNNDLCLKIQEYKNDKV